jgi:hypothetical protein
VYKSVIIQAILITNLVATDIQDAANSTLIVLIKHWHLSAFYTVPKFCNRNVFSVTKNNGFNFGFRTASGK